MASLSKREQARNERELQDLLRQPGNSQCADCNARNPNWASWNLGIFLCMRCASIHRKLGTHISKVKSLSMDKWTTDQVESMKQHGNNVSNKHYNPKNKKPDIPLDADEVDSAMERYIRKKYQEKSLVDGRPEPPSRTDMSPSLSQSAQPLSDPELPPTGKKHKFFGFSLRTSSKKDRAGAQDAFRVTPVEYSPTSGQVREVSDRELQEKLAQLRDMGFPDNERNMNILNRQGGDIERSIAMLVRLGPSEISRQLSRSPAPPRQQPTTSSAPQSATTSNNPWAQLDRPQAQSQQSSGFGLSFNEPKQQAPQQQAPTQQPAQPNANPWQSAIPAQQTTGLEHQFAGMQVSNPLFPHHTGGYVASSYQDSRLQTMTPPVPAVPQQYGYTASPTSNPFYQQPLSSQSTGNNPFIQQQQSQPVFAPQTNPFMAMQQAQDESGQPSSSNPFGLPPAQQAQHQQYMQKSQLQPQPQQQQQYIHPQAQPQQQSTNPFGIPSQASPPPIQQSQTFPLAQQHSATYGQPQPQQQQQMQLQPQFQPQQTQQQEAFYQNQQFSAQQPQPLQAQATGRYTKTDIMALFGQPASYAQPPLPSVQEAYDDPTNRQQQGQMSQHVPQQQQQQFQQQQTSPAPNHNPYGALGMNMNNTATPGKRSATMPVMSSMHSSGGTGSRNPFLSQSQQSSSSTLSSANPFGQPVAQQGGYQVHAQGGTYGGQTAGWNQGARHASNESVSVNNPALMDGRHSPDAFASLSSRTGY